MHILHVYLILLVGLRVALLLEFDQGGVGPALAALQLRMRPRLHHRAPLHHCAPPPPPRRWTPSYRVPMGGLTSGLGVNT